MDSDKVLFATKCDIAKKGNKILKYRLEDRRVEVKKGLYLNENNGYYYSYNSDDKNKKVITSVGYYKITDKWFMTYNIIQHTTGDLFSKEEYHIKGTFIGNDRDQVKFNDDIYDLDVNASYKPCITNIVQLNDEVKENINYDFSATIKFTDEFASAEGDNQEKEKYELYLHSNGNFELVIKFYSFEPVDMFYSKVLDTATIYNGTYNILRKVPSYVVSLDLETIKTLGKKSVDSEEKFEKIDTLEEVMRTITIELDGYKAKFPFNCDFVKNFKN